MTLYTYKVSFAVFGEWDYRFLASADMEDNWRVVVDGLIDEPGNTPEVREANVEAVGSYLLGQVVQHASNQGRITTHDILVLTGWELESMEEYSETVKLGVYQNESNEELLLHDVPNSVAE